MKKCLLVLAAVLVALTACSKQNEPKSEQSAPTRTGHDFTLTVSASAEDLRVETQFDEVAKQLRLRWQEGDKIYAYVSQKVGSDALYTVTELDPIVLTATDVKNEGKSCAFTLTVPGVVHGDQPFDLFLTLYPGTKSGSLYTSYHLAMLSPTALVPIAQLSKVGCAATLTGIDPAQASNPLTATFKQLGAFALLDVESRADVTVSTAYYGIQINGLEGFSGWYLDDYTGGIKSTSTVNNHDTDINYAYSLAAGSTTKMGIWFYPNGAITSVTLSRNINYTSSASVPHAVSPAVTPVAGKFYHLPKAVIGTDKKIQWDGVVIYEEPTGNKITINGVAGSAKITVSGTNYFLDLNGNNHNDGGDEVPTSGTEVTVNVPAEFKIFGDVTSFRTTKYPVSSSIEGMDIDVSNHTTLQRFEVLNTASHPSDTFVGKFTTAANSALTAIDLLLKWAEDTGISLGGATNLTSLVLHDVGGNSKLPTLTAAQKAQLKVLSLSRWNPSYGTPKLSTLDLSGYTGLENLTLNYNAIQTLTMPTAPNLKYVRVNHNKITGSVATALMNALPTRAAADGAQLIFYGKDPAAGYGATEGNSATAADVAIATGKGWSVLNLDGSAYAGN